MLKTISAALIAVSMIAAPAMAASPTKTRIAPITKPLAPSAKQQFKPGVLEANARMSRHHHHHVRHHASHRKISAHGTAKHAKVSIRHASPTFKRG